MHAGQGLSRAVLGTVATLALALAALQARATDEPSIEIRLHGFSEVPVVSTVAQGRFKAWLDQGIVRYELSYSGLEGDVRQAHIHLGQRGVNGGIMVWLCQTSFNVDPLGRAPICPPSGSVSGVLDASVIGAQAAAQGVAAGEFAEFVAAVRAGVAYVNVHSTKYPGGELRGQLQAGHHH
ncbi:MAG: CHRD domain-containing protein [Burkholderiales bacterium]|nr:CHRD domain-containing protein [Burkholderiales bacterium]